MTQTYLQSES